MADPIADKLLIGSVALITVWEHFGITLTALIIGIEIVIALSAYLRYSRKLMPAKTVGKVKMILQCVGVLFALLYGIFPVPFLLIFSQYVLYGAIVFALLSLFVFRSI